PVPVGGAAGRAPAGPPLVWESGAGRIRRRVGWMPPPANRAGGNAGHASRRRRRPIEQTKTPADRAGQGAGASSTRDRPVCDGGRRRVEPVAGALRRARWGVCRLRVGGRTGMASTAAVEKDTATSAALDQLPPRLREAVGPLVDRLDVELIARAYRFAEVAHAGQKRASGEEYIQHCVEVATILAELSLDTVSIAAGLIHDVVEDTGTPLEVVEEEFGQEIATVVDGVTKIGEVQFRSTTGQQVENYRKLLLSMAQDARVILIKLADRLHNLRTLDHLRPEKRQRIALETREIYAPLA